MTDDNNFKSGFVAIMGRPNTGKSTLLNAIMGGKVAITSARPQTTRNQIRGIYNAEGLQIVFLDTPGLHKPASALGEYMMKAARSALSGVDAALFLAEPLSGNQARGKRYEADKELLAAVIGKGARVYLIINKLDTAGKADIAATIEAYKDLFDFAHIIPLSAATGENVPELLAALRADMPPGPRYFPEDMFTDQPERQIVAEFIREQALRALEDEVPHGVFAEVESMKTRAAADGGATDELMDIEAVIYCERDSHKGIIIGKNGAMLKKIGTGARISAERLLGCRVNLSLWVKVKKDWRQNERQVKNFGFDSKKL